MAADPIPDGECGRPCDPAAPCNECAVYWQRMRDEGYWDDRKGWTNRGIKDIARHAWSDGR